MAKTDSEMLEKYKARIKRQNEAIKENYDRVSATLPRGTIDRIKNLGLTINGAINASLITYLDCMEEENEKQPDEHRTGEENAINSGEKEPQLIDKSDNHIVSAHVKDERKRSETTGLTPEESNKKFQAVVAEKKAEIEKEQQKQTGGGKADENLNPELRQQEESADDDLKKHLETIRRKREQITREREQFGELTPEDIRAMYCEMGSDLLNEENREAVIARVGEVNYGRIVEYVKSPRFY